MDYETKQVLLQIAKVLEVHAREISTNKMLSHVSAEAAWERESRNKPLEELKKLLGLS